MFAKVYKLFNYQRRKDFDGFPIELINKVDHCIIKPELYKKYFLNITELARQEFNELSSKRDNNFIALSFIAGFSISADIVYKMFDTHLKVGSVGLYANDLYIITKINRDKKRDERFPIVEMKLMSWGRDNSDFEVEDVKMYYDKFIFSNDDTVLNLLMIPGVEIDKEVIEQSLSLTKSKLE